MSLAALTPQFGSEMEDSAMHEDHPADSAIAIDMESPKHHVLTPHGTSYGDSTAATTFWSHSQSQEAAHHVVDVEFETAGTYEDVGMMAATEVEMTAAVPYEEDNELEMAYESGQPEFNFEVEDAEVRDAEEAYEGHSHGQHAASQYAPLEHEQPQESLSLPTPETETLGGPDPAAGVTPTVEPSFHVNENAADAPPAEEVAPDPVSQKDRVSDLARESHLPDGTLTTTAEPKSSEDPAHDPPLELGQERPEAMPHTDDKTPRQSPEAHVSEAPFTTAEEPVADYEVNAQEEVEGEIRYEGVAPPILLTTYSESSKSALLALFNDPDAAMIPSSSSTETESPVVLLDQHQYLFGEPIAVLLTHLRAEILQAESQIMSPSEFEYKEAQIVVRDLQLVLTEVRFIHLGKLMLTTWL